MSWLGGLTASKRNIVVPRHADRYQTIGLNCDVGEVVDLSATGMKVSCARKPAIARGDVVTFSIRSATQRLVVMGRVAWTRRQGLRAHTIGVQFLNLKPGVPEALVEFALHGFVAPRQASTRSSPVRASVEVEDLYKALDVARTAPDTEIAAAYRKAARLLHPDVNSSPDAAEKFTLVSKAYSVLRDPEKRRKYDEMFARSAAA